MKKYIIFLSFIVLIISCKKDYPSDIPKWLKNKINECKSESIKTGEHCHCGPNHIYRFYLDGQTYFQFNYDYPSTDDYYNYYYNYLCVYDLDGNEIECCHYYTENYNENDFCYKVRALNYAGFTEIWRNDMPTFLDK